MQLKNNVGQFLSFAPTTQLKLNFKKLIPYNQFRLKVLETGGYELFKDDIKFWPPGYLLAPLNSLMISQKSTEETSV